MSYGNCDSCNKETFNSYCPTCKEYFDSIEPLDTLQDNRIVFYGNLEPVVEDYSLNKYEEQITEDPNKVNVNNFIATLQADRRNLYLELFSDCLTLQDIATRRNWTIAKVRWEVKVLLDDFQKYLLYGYRPKRRGKPRIRRVASSK